MRRLIRLKLKILAQLILKKYRPTVIGVTGSMGKTSTKEAIYQVLSGRENVRMSPKNYNNELGVPLTIIGATAAGRNLFAWIKIFAAAGKLLLVRDKNYPHVLVLEMGVDRPGDMAYLTRIVKPDVGVVTAVSYSHLEYFGSLAEVKKEKQGLIEKVKHSGLAVLNYDDEATRSMVAVSPARVLTYGLQAGANLRAQDIIFNFDKGRYELAGLNFKLNYNGSIVPVFMLNVLTEPALYAALAATAVGLYFNLNLVEIAQALKDFSLPHGRMNVLPGLKHTFIIDDTYNSSPAAAASAVSVLGRIKVEEPAVKYVVLGDMLELGDYSAEAHRRLGEQVVANGLTHLISVGSQARDIIKGAQAAGLADDFIFSFDHSEEVGAFLLTKLKAGDIVLVKGSQGMRMERIVKEIMAEPRRAAELLVRQGEEWRDK